MSTVEEPAFVAETLTWCNEVRQENGLAPLDRLPKGKPRDPQTCPCGAATGLHVEFRSAYPAVENWYEHPVVCDLPDPVMEFVHQFDNGKLPQYEL